MSRRRESRISSCWIPLRFDPGGAADLAPHARIIDLRAYDIVVNTITSGATDASRPWGARGSAQFHEYAMEAMPFFDLHQPGGPTGVRRHFSRSAGRIRKETPRWRRSASQSGLARQG